MKSFMMKIKDQFIRATQVVDRWLWKLVGKENDILFHFLRIVLGCVLLAVLVAAALGVGKVLAMVIPPLIAALVAAIPYLITIAVFLGIVGLLVLQSRHEKRQRFREREKQETLKRQAEDRQRARAVRIRQSVLAADPTTRKHIESVLASLRRFDHRLELSLTPDHYMNLFGDNWVNVREFAESSYGRKVPEVSGLLVEIIILYKQAQEIPWIPDNLRRMQAWWGEASRKRKWLSEIMDEAQAPTPIASSPMVLAAEVLEEPELFPIPEMSVQPPPSPAGKRGGIPEMAVQPPPSILGRRPAASSIPEMAVVPPPAPLMRMPEMVVQPPPVPSMVHRPAEIAVVGPAPRLSSPPTLEELQRYCIWINGKA